MRCLLLLLAIFLPTLHARADDASFAQIWRETGLERIGVQYRGINRTLLSFSKDALRNVTSHDLIEDHDEITLVLRLIANPGSLADERIIPVEGDDLIPVLDRAGIEVENRSIRLGDCLLFNEQGQISGQGPALIAAANAYVGNAPGTPIHVSIDRLAGRLQELMMLSTDLRIIPHPVDAGGQWSNIADAPEGPADGVKQSLARLLRAVGADDLDDARAQATDLVAGVQTLPNYPSETRLRVDYAYTRYQPYFFASFAYVLAAVLFFVSLVTKSDRWWWAAMAVMAAGWIIHALGAAARGYLIQRMPLSNLYEATTTGLVFVIAIAFALELIYRMKVIGLTSAALSFLYYRWIKSTDYGSDAIEPLRAVLNSYWLDYHVTCMIISYAAFTVAFSMAVLYLLKIHFPRLMEWSPSAEQLDLYNHRAIQVGWPILGIGVVLGAVWADTAWGRMWSWDPKETWALITWLIYTAYMHVRLIAGWKGAATAWTSIGGYGCVLFTYLGVNFVLSGLHSYAGNDPVALTGLGGMFKQYWYIFALVAGMVVAFPIWYVFGRGRDKESLPAA